MQNMRRGATGYDRFKASESEEDQDEEVDLEKSSLEEEDRDLRGENGVLGKKARVREEKGYLDDEDRSQALEYDFSTNSYRLATRQPSVVYDGEELRSPRSATELNRQFPRRDSFELDRRNSVLTGPMHYNDPISQEDGVCCEAYWPACLTASSVMDEEDFHEAQREAEDGSDPRAPKPCIHRVRYWIQYIWFHIVYESSWFCLLLLGVISSVLAWCIDELVAIMVSSKSSLAHVAQSSIVSYLLWTFLTMSLALGSVFFTNKISPTAAGSGIPQIKSILGGFEIPGYLSLRTLISKVVGLLLALGSGMVIGKEGPFVHISCIIANQLMRLPIFTDLRRSPALRKQILAAACAVGVSSTFGAPIGGVLFSIEVTSSLYQVSEYWKGYFCVVCGAFVFKELSFFGQARNNVISLFTTNFDPLPYNFVEIPLFVLLSVICGYLGGAFVLFQKSWSDYRKDRASPRFIKNSYSAALFVAFVTSAANFPLGDFMEYSLHDAIDDLFVNQHIKDAQHSQNWDHPTLFINLILFASIKCVLVVLAINLPIPCGVFTPVFAVGAAVGRFFGELVYLLGGQGVTAGGYALVGASAFTAGATGTVSTSVIVFELTNQLSYMLPVLLSVLIGQATARQISVSIYESLARVRNLPSFPQLRKQASYGLPVYKVMSSQAPCIARYVTKNDIEEALLRADNSALDPLYVFAIVDNLKDRFYLASVTWKALHILKQTDGIWVPSLDQMRWRGNRRTKQQDEMEENNKQRDATEEGGQQQQQQQEQQQHDQSKGIQIDLFKFCDLDRSTISVPHTTALNDALNFFNLHKRKSFFVVRHGVVIGKLYLRDVATKCANGEL